MPIQSYLDYKDKVAAAYQRSNDTKVSITTVAGRQFSYWLSTPDAGTAPTTALICTQSTPGAMGQQGSEYVQYLTQIPAVVGGGGAGGGCLMICDRLSHQGGLSGIVTGNVTTNLPTAALTRYTDGKGVFLAYEVYTVIGTTQTIISASYTNQDGVSGRQTKPTDIGGANYRTVSRCHILPLQEGDTGVRSVESINVTGSTGTAGAFGITLFKPLALIPIINVGGNVSINDSVVSMANNFIKVENSASLYYQIFAETTTTGVLLANNRFIEDQNTVVW